MAPRTTASGRSRTPSARTREAKPTAAQLRAERERAAAKALFLDNLAGHGTITEAAKAAGVGRSTVFDWRDVDAEFAKAWDDAITASTDALEREAFRRAVEGESDRMLEVMLRARRPERFRETYRVEHSGPDGDPIRISSIADAVLAKLGDADDDA